MDKFVFKPTRQITIRKYRAIQKRYKELYDIKRFRYDDVMNKLKDEFFIVDTKTIQRILRTDLSDIEKEAP